MSLYTAILEFRGGLYISQLSADSETQAVEEWLRTLDAQLPELKNTERLDLADGFRDDKPVKLDGLNNVWCSSALGGENLALLNVVKTSEN